MPDPTEAGLTAQHVHGLDGVLAAFNTAGILCAADVHVARRVAALCDDPVADEVLLATALTVRAVRSGSTCLELNRIDELAAEHEAERTGAVAAADGDPVTAPAWPSSAAVVAALTDSPLVVGSPAGPLRPLALGISDDGPLLYLQKYFRQEAVIRRILAQRAASRPDVDATSLAAAIRSVFHTADPMAQTHDGELFYNRQFAAAVLAATSWTTVLAGGPGTGKTHTVARALHALTLLAGDDQLRIGLCAPTGRAAAQLQSAVDDYGRLPAGTAAVTVHRLLGSRSDGTFRHGPDNRLPYDVVVVDETSMLPMTLMSRLISALRHDCRLILVGDPHQLASVEAGAVLADLVARTPSGPADPVFDRIAISGRGDFSAAERAALADGVITLVRGHRFGHQINEVASAVNAGDAERVLALAADPDYERVEMVSPDDLSSVRSDVLDWARELHARAAAGDASGALLALNSHRVLCAHRDGASGVSGLSARIIEWISGLDGYRTAVRDGASWYVGQPLLVTANDRQHGVYNGDSGVVIDAGGARNAVFARGKSVKSLHPSQLAEATSVYAMTIHRSQGSQFDVVTVILPPEGSELLTRELLYTALTRAKERVRIVGTADSLRAAVGRRVQRASGLRGDVRVVGVESGGADAG